MIALPFVLAPLIPSLPTTPLDMLRGRRACVTSRSGKRSQMKTLLSLISMGNISSSSKNGTFWAAAYNRKAIWNVNPQRQESSPYSLCRES